MDIELDAFSGRPNPRWAVSERESAHLLKEIASLPAAADFPNPPDLGFRGYVLHDGDRTIRVFRSRIVVEMGGKRKAYKDSRGIEEELAVEARRHGFAGIIGQSF
jgi:hypothetical protein